MKSKPSLAFLRDGRGVVFTGGSPSAQLLVEETAEDMTALAHGATDSLQDQKPVSRKAPKSNTDLNP